MSENLPALAKMTGGELAEVLEWEQHSSLPPSAKVAITQVVRSYPALNTSHAVDLLADIAGHHKTEIDPWMSRLVSEVGLEHVHLAFECLREAGVSGSYEKKDDKNATDEEKNDQAAERFKQREWRRGHVEQMIALIDTIKQHLGDLPFAGQVTNIIHHLGGWENVSKTDPDELDNLLARLYPIT